MRFSAPPEWGCDPVQQSELARRADAPLHEVTHADGDKPGSERPQGEAGEEGRASRRPPLQLERANVTNRRAVTIAIDGAGKAALADQQQRPGPVPATARVAAIDGRTQRRERARLRRAPVEGQRSEQ